MDSLDAHFRKKTYLNKQHNSLIYSFPIFKQDEDEELQMLDLGTNFPKPNTDQDRATIVIFNFDIVASHTGWMFLS